jgi:hypothetical protein
MSNIIKITVPARGLATGTPITMEASGYKGPVCSQKLAQFNLGRITKVEQTAEYYEAPAVVEQQITQEG